MNLNSEVSYAFYIKLFILILGTIFFITSIYFYHRSIFKTESDVKASFGSWKILIKRATPGTLFLVASTLIILIGASKKMSSTTSYKQGIDENELNKNIQSLRLDTSIVTNNKSKLDIDSMIKSANSQATKKRYLNALKTLYLAKGVIFFDSSKGSRLQEINQSIVLFETFLNEQLNSLPRQNNLEQTRSTNINSQADDSIR